MAVNVRRNLNTIFSPRFSYPFACSSTKLELMVESDAIREETTAGPPTDDTYVGCFADTLDDRVMSIVTTLDDLTPEVRMWCERS